MGLQLLLILSLFSLSFSVIVGLYLLAKFFIQKTRPRAYLLYWSLGCLGLFWFQLPVIFASAGKNLVLSDYRWFLSAAFGVSFLSFDLIRIGLVKAYELSDRKIKMPIYLLRILAASVAVWGLFSNPFAFPKFVTMSAALLFFLPIHFLLGQRSYNALTQRRDLPFEQKLALGGLMVGSSLMIAQDLLVAYLIKIFSTGTLFFGLISSKPLFLLQALSTIFLLLLFISYRPFRKL